MIKVTRSSQPDIITEKEREWLRNLLVAQSISDHDKAEKKYNHPKIRATLINMFWGKCAYCESRIIHVSYPQIEHYRPKAKYPRHTFHWRNLLLACGVCNSSKYKGDHFPLVSAHGPIINPCCDDPDDHLDFNFDPATSIANVDGKTPRGKTTEVLLGLNRPELRKHRSLYLKKIFVLAQHAANDPIAHQIVAEALKADEEYTAFTKKFVTFG